MVILHILIDTVDQHLFAAAINVLNFSSEDPPLEKDNPLVLNLLVVLCLCQDLPNIFVTLQRDQFLRLYALLVQPEVLTIYSCHFRVRHQHTE